MNHEVYLRMNEKLHPSPSRIEEVAKYAHRKQRIRLKRTAVAVLTSAAVLCGGMTLGASASEDFRQMLYDISPEIAATFSPVMESCVSDGIRVTVEAVHLNNDDAEVIVAFEDLTGERDMEYFDLCDSYSLTRGLLPYSGEIASSGITSDYDPETGINRKHIYIHEPGVIDKEGQTLTFSVKRAVYGMERRTNVRMPVELVEISCDPPTRTAEETLVYKDIYGGFGGSGMETENFDFWAQRYLAPQEPVTIGQNIELTAVGWVNGYLHVQTRKTHYTGIEGASFWLVKDGEEHWESLSALWSPEKGTVCEELFIPIGCEELADCALYGDVLSGGTEIRGDWKIKFRLKNTDGDIAQKTDGQG